MKTLHTLTRTERATRFAFALSALTAVVSLNIDRVKRLLARATTGCDLRRIITAPTKLHPYVTAFPLYPES